MSSSIVRIMGGNVRRVPGAVACSAVLCRLVDHVPDAPNNTGPAGMITSRPRPPARAARPLAPPARNPRRNVGAMLSLDQQQGAHVVINSRVFSGGRTPLADAVRTVRAMRTVRAVRTAGAVRSR